MLAFHAMDDYLGHDDDDDDECENYYLPVPKVLFLVLQIIRILGIHELTTSL